MPPRSSHHKRKRDDATTTTTVDNNTTATTEDPDSDLNFQIPSKGLRKIMEFLHSCRDVVRTMTFTPTGFIAMGAHREVGYACEIIINKSYFERYQCSLSVVTLSLQSEDWKRVLHDINIFAPGKPIIVVLQKDKKVIWIRDIDRTVVREIRVKDSTEAAAAAPQQQQDSDRGFVSSFPVELRTHIENMVYSHQIELPTTKFYRVVDRLVPSQTRFVTLQHQVDQDLKIHWLDAKTHQKEEVRFLYHQDVAAASAAMVSPTPTKDKVVVTTTSAAAVAPPSSTPDFEGTYRRLLLTPLCKTNFNPLFTIRMGTPELPIELSMDIHRDLEHLQDRSFIRMWIQAATTK